MSIDFRKEKPVVAVAMSGGVDSSVSAHLLLEEGFQVFGIHMELWTPSPLYDGPDGSDGRNRNRENLEKTAAALGIEVRFVSVADRFQKQVIGPFIEEYKSARTPNPCVRCNQTIKFGALLELAEQFGAKFLATGHYAQIKELTGGRYAIKTAQDQSKNQAYYLYGLNQSALQKTIFPLAHRTKTEVREIARRLRLPASESSESQEICFIHDNDYRRFLRESEVSFQPGRILDRAERVLTNHEGKENFTIGQRKGLGVALGVPAYVTEIRIDGDVVLGEKADTLSSDFVLVDPVFQAWNPEFLNSESSMEALVQIRYRSSPVPCKVSVHRLDQTGSIQSLRVHTIEPVSSITPGQSGVLYQKDHPDSDSLMVAAGGIIQLVEPVRENSA